MGSSSKPKKAHKKDRKKEHKKKDKKRPASPAQELREDPTLPLVALQPHAEVVASPASAVLDDDAPTTTAPSKRAKTEADPAALREQQARRKLLAARERMPEWMRESVKIAGAPVALRELGLSQRMLTVLESMTIHVAFPVQATVIPFLLRQTRFAAGDAAVMSATGSGKTLAFAIPIVEMLSESRVRRVACLCVLPTKDLAAQVHEVFALLCAGTHLRVVLFAGDRPFQEEVEQVATLPDIVVATPGRLRDHLHGALTRHVLATLRWLVIDEGDRLLSKQYHQWITDLMPMLQNPSAIVQGPFQGTRVLVCLLCCLQRLFYFFVDPPLQKLLFSATMTSNPRKLAMLELYRPTFFHAVGADPQQDVLEGTSVLPATLSEYQVKCAREDDRPLVLAWLLQVHLPAELQGVLVFVSTIERAQRLHVVLEALLPSQRVGLYASSMTLRDREAALEKFRSGALRILVVTDVLARGLDIASIGAVVNYDCPFRAQTYIHRVGRTARALRQGAAYTLGLRTELPRWRKMRGVLRGGNVVETVVKPDTAFITGLRPVFEETLERMLRLVRRRPGAEERLELQERRVELSVPLTAHTHAQAMEVLARNRKYL